MKKISVLFLVLFITAGALHGGHGDTDVRDASALRSVMNDWQNSPPSWGQDNDPCSTPWEGVVCQNSRVTVLRLSTMGLKGTLSSDISQLAELQSLDLSYNDKLGGPIPPSIGNLLQLTTFFPSISFSNLANNQLSGPMPNLTGMNLLNYVDLSNNSFLTEAPTWFTTIESLTVLVMESGGLYGNIPPKVFSSPQIQQVLLANNALNGILDLGQTSSELQIVNLQNNAISGYKSSLSYNGTVVLVGNPVCSNQLANSIYCSLQQEQEKPYSTSLGQCNPTSCYLDLSVNPQSCACAYPYQGMLIFRAPFFRDVSNPSRFQELERYLWTNLNLTPGSVYLSHVIFNDNNYLELQLKLFPPTEIYFTRLEIQKLGFYLSNQTFKPPAEFGPYYFIGSPYAFPGQESALFTMITGIIIGCIVLVIVLAIVAIYAFTQKKRAERAGLLQIAIDDAVFGCGEAATSVARRQECSTTLATVMSGGNDTTTTSRFSLSVCVSLSLSLV